ncbi:unnamed protein product [Cyclocybe aegerita]|uniref:Uncharacterized protein n=1 Tax=Cyclocybe aegerita TaxID=1973307 RepID=A0A8S0WAR7_CYCAE|nr:unnamed protein product [Cyclocybe aegerita]
MRSFSQASGFKLRWRNTARIDRRGLGAHTQRQPSNLPRAPSAGTIQEELLAMKKPTKRKTTRCDPQPHAVLKPHTGTPVPTPFVEKLSDFVNRTYVYNSD